MTVNLVTVAVFDHPIPANLARNELEADGIRAFLEGAEIAEMNWALTNAIGGIRLKVDEIQREKAEFVLKRLEAERAARKPEDVFRDEDFGDETPVDPSEAEAEKASDDDQAIAVADSSPRELAANRALKAAILGLVFIPLQLYVFYLLLWVFLSNETLSAAAWRRATIAAFICIPMLLLVLPWIVFAYCGMFSGFEWMWLEFRPIA